jgi:serine/threonine protein phosphatase PrpC
MTEFSPPAPVDTTITPGTIGGNLTVSDTSADSLMQSMNGELLTGGISAGWENKPKGDRLSEDSVYISTDGVGQTFMGVFDGMGGYGSGDVMSAIASNRLHGLAIRNRDINPAGLIEDFFPDVVEDIRAKVSSSREVHESAGTTGLVGVVKRFDNGSIRLTGGAVGDSLGYIVRKNGLVEPLNKEESMRQEMLDMGESIEDADRRGNVVTNVLNANGYLGTKQRFDTEVFEGDVIVFTSDGITGDKSTQRLSGGDSNEDVIRQIALDRTLTPKQKAQKIVGLSNKKDDKTALFVEIRDQVNQGYSDSQIEAYDNKFEKNGTSAQTAMALGDSALAGGVNLVPSADGLPDPEDFTDADQIHDGSSARSILSAIRRRISTLTSKEVFDPEGWKSVPVTELVSMPQNELLKLAGVKQGEDVLIERRRESTSANGKAGDSYIMTGAKVDNVFIDEKTGQLRVMVYWQGIKNGEFSTWQKPVSVAEIHRLKVAYENGEIKSTMGPGILVK